MKWRSSEREQKMEIHEIKITNFRNIGDTQSFRLNPRFTVVIGINGKGKSTILNAVRIASGSYILGIPVAQKRHIVEAEIRRVDHGSHLSMVTPTIVETTGSIDGIELTRPWRRMIPKDGTRTTSNANDVGEIRGKAAEKYHQINDLGNIEVDNPVIAYFGTSRLHGNSKNTMGRYIGREVFRYGYYNWADMKFPSYQYEDWLRSFPYLVSEGKEDLVAKEVFFNTLKLANPYIVDIDFDGKELRLRTQIDGVRSQYLPLSLHSDGMITHTAMVAELAFRCVTLNSHRKAYAIESSRGVVMIDEIDLHIHPSWQRHIVADLKAAFPSIQFVATTHSPFIVQSLSAEELINLDKVTDVDPNKLSIEEVAEEIMGVDSSMSVENTSKEQLATKYLTDLEADESGNLDASRFEQIEQQISDPGLRAFLKMNKLRKEHESSK